MSDPTTESVNSVAIYNWAVLVPHWNSNSRPQYPVITLNTITSSTYFEHGTCLITSDLKFIFIPGAGPYHPSNHILNTNRPLTDMNLHFATQTKSQSPVPSMEVKMRHNICINVNIWTPLTVNDMVIDTCILKWSHFVKSGIFQIIIIMSIISNSD